ncbi:Mrp8p ASCRUDRAFT_153685 [Ascoidea rubescens DSM 1968]|uniref:Uncharacterized protein n=1 Tax=Ascoidea rubescens DSM 1968 TaxID=1344418 RepID=A0A1D2VFI3_9ASCO|nr:hypothetical protein ASCRUDRAFT_153685 [Ascoidea rubescens DSM 1968]ODV60359.1 hypothetical protein ASCRUDRAFT_153685 [Ascoidea rubescens DSM 1968]
MIHNKFEVANLHLRVDILERQIMLYENRQSVFKHELISAKREFRNRNDTAGVVENLNQRTYESYYEKVADELRQLEERTIRRSINSHIKDTNESRQKIVPLTNFEGEYPPSGILPRTVSELKRISNDDLKEVLSHYRLVHSLTPDPYNMSTEDLCDVIGCMTDRELDRHFVIMADYLGVRVKRNGISDRNPDPVCVPVTDSVSSMGVDL